jgi:serine/threonine protein kinase
MYCPTCKKSYEAGAFCASDGTALVAAPGTGLLGQVLAERYRIERLIGEGGMGEVYEARHVNINKRFAIKLLKPEVVGSPQSVQRFRQEAWAASSIGHENIVEIDDFATLPDGSVYLAMELLDGVTLADRLRDGPPISLEEGVYVMLTVARGLAAAHDKNIVHRDMKPENVFLAKKNGRQVAKILDFGIAKMSGAEEPSNLTRTGSIFGTPLYMSPEQARGKPADRRSDVYSVGVILYELATGSVPFSGESPVEILSQHIGAEPVAPTELAPDRAIPPRLEAAILRALAKEPEARFATMAELAAELEAVQQLLPAFSPSSAHGLVGARPPSGMNPLVATPSRASPLAAGAQVALPSGANAQVATPARAGAQVATPSGAGAQVATPSGASAVIARPSSAMRAARPIATPGARAPSGAMDARAASGPLPIAAREPSGALAIAQGAQVTSESPLGAGAADEPAAARGRGRAIAIAALVVAIGGGVAAWRLWPRAPAPPTTTPSPSSASSAASSPAAQTAAAEGEQAAKPAEAGAREVIVDSLPTGAKIVRDGKVVAETPEALTFTMRSDVVLQKEGFADKTVTIDPTGAHKVVVKLERAHPHVVKPAVAAVEPPATPHPDAKQPPRPTIKRVEDPYELVGEKPAAKRPPPSPPHPPAPRDELAARVASAAAQAAPGSRRVGPIYAGVAAQRNDHTDWFIPLEAGRCYTFIAEGGDGLDGVFLYLWGPAGRRVHDARVRTPHASMAFCTAIPGVYHLQAKAAEGHGDFRVGVFTR